MLGLELESDEVSTVGGYVTQLIGHLPHAGEKTRVRGFRGHRDEGGRPARAGGAFQADPASGGLISFEVAGALMVGANATSLLRFGGSSGSDATNERITAHVSAFRSVRRGALTVPVLLAEALRG